MALIKKRLITLYLNRYFTKFFGFKFDRDYIIVGTGGTKCFCFRISKSIIFPLFFKIWKKLPPPLSTALITCCCVWGRPIVRSATVGNLPDVRSKVTKPNNLYNIFFGEKIKF